MEHLFYYFSDLNSEPEVLNLKFKTSSSAGNKQTRTAVFNPDCFFKKIITLNRTIYKKITDKQDFFKDLFPIDKKLFNEKRICVFKLSGKSEIKIAVFCLKPLSIDLSSFNYIAPADLYFLIKKQNSTFKKTSYIFDNNEFAEFNFGELFSEEEFNLNAFIKMFKSKKITEENFIAANPVKKIKIPFFSAAAAILLLSAFIFQNYLAKKAIASLTEKKANLKNTVEVYSGEKEPVFNTLELLGRLTENKLIGIDMALLKIEGNRFFIEGTAQDLTTLEKTAENFGAKITNTNVLAAGIRFTMESGL